MASVRKKEGLSGYKLGHQEIQLATASLCAVAVPSCRTLSPESALGSLTVLPVSSFPLLIICTLAVIVNTPLSLPVPCRVRAWVFP